ncbi:hypothetical protein BGW39_008709 [Mortierella sp. 14UC]|nr:hypothetical protein BGW39_008709 [Mortierella sp. 14UC]
MPFYGAALCYLNHVRDCRKQNDAEALSLQFNNEFLAACKDEYKIATTSKVPEAVRELGHSRSSVAARPPHESSANTRLPLTPTSDAMLSSKAQNDHKQQSAAACLLRYTAPKLSQEQQGIYEMDKNVEDKPTQSEGSTDIVHEENQPESDFTEEEITRAKATPFYDLILHVFKKAVSLLPKLSQRMSRVEALLSELLLALCPGIEEDPYAEPNLLGLQLKVWELLSQLAKLTARDKEQKAVHAALLTMGHICSLLAIGQLEPPTSEHIYVSAWTQVFNTLFHGTKVRAIPGELVSTAARDCRLLIEDEFGPTNKYICGRKVDMSIRVYADHTWDNEICVFEFKSTKASDAVCQQQQRKSVRLNGAILLDLEGGGLDITKSYPAIAEGRGLVVDFYTLRRYEDILGAGRSTMSRAYKKIRP